MSPGAQDVDVSSAIDLIAAIGVSWDQGIMGAGPMVSARGPVTLMSASVSGQWPVMIK